MPKNPPPDEGARHIRPFADWLREQSAGRTHNELGEGLHDLIARVRDTGKKGTLTLTVSVAPLDKDVSTLVVSDEIRLKLPEHDRKASIFYTDDAGNLSRTDPNQPEISGLRVAPGHDDGDAPIDAREVN